MCFATRELFFWNSVIWITTRSIMDCRTTHNLFTEKNLPINSFYTKADKSVKAVTRHLPKNSSSEDTTVAPQELGYDIVIIK
jgi:hypothetical protein